MATLKKLLKTVYREKVHKVAEKLKHKEKAFTYGEITQLGVEQFIKSLPREITSDDYFLDIGSGRGKMVLHMALSTPVKKSVGVELMESRHNDAIKLKKKIGSKTDRIEFHFADVFETDLLKKATIVYANTIMWDYDDVVKIVKSLNPGTLLIINKLLYKPNKKPFNHISTKYNTSWQNLTSHYLIEISGKEEFLSNENGEVDTLVEETIQKNSNLENAVDKHKKIREKMEERKQLAEKILQENPELQEIVADVMAGMIGSGELEFENNEQFELFMYELIIQHDKGKKSKQDAG